MSIILGIDTSCDDTAAAVVENGTKVISNIVSTQTEIHTKYGGIVPELASRKHIQTIWPVVDEALMVSGIRLEDLAGVAVCHGPGLIGSLLVGCSFAKALCYSKDIPFLAVNHLEGHIFSVFLEESKPVFPFLALIVSGGHTSVKLRYKQPDGDTSKLISVAVRDRVGELTPNLGFASAVAEFGMLLRRSEFKGQATWATAQELARRYRGDDPDGYRAEFVRLVELAAALDAQNLTSPQSRR